MVIRIYLTSLTLLWFTLFFSPLRSHAQIDCSNATEIELIGVGTYNQASANLSIPNHESATAIILEVIARPTGGNPQVTFTAGAQVISPTGTQMTQYRNGSTTNTSDLLFRATVSPKSTVSMTASDANAFSFVAYVSRPSSTQADFKGNSPIFTYLDAGVKFLEIPTHTENRNLTVVVPITELTNDSRIARVTVSAGGVSVTQTETTFNLGNTLRFMTFNLNNVSGSATQVMIRSESPGGNGAAGSGNGDSFFTGSAVYSTNQCDCGANTSVASSNPAESNAISATQAGIGHVQNAIGEPGTSFAEFYNNSNYLILALEADIPVNSTYDIFWSSRTVNTARMIVSESADGINFITQSAALVTSGTNKVKTTVTAAQTTRYIRIDKRSITTVPGITVTGGFDTGSDQDFNIYGMSYSFTATGTGCNNASFPVEWLDFAVKLQAKDALLNWSTASELDVDYFTIERSIDGIFFNPIDFVPATGTSQSVNTYAYQDLDVVNLGVRKVFYRIQETDLNGGIDHSNVIELNLPANFPIALKAYPNPATDKVNITVQSEGAGYPELHILNSLGQQVHHQLIELDRSTGTVQLDVTGWVPGFYMVQITDENQQATFKLIVR